MFVKRLTASIFGQGVIISPLKMLQIETENGVFSTGFTEFSRLTKFIPRIIFNRWSLANDMQRIQRSPPK